MSETYLYLKPDSPIPNALLKEEIEWGYHTLTLVEPPRRFWGEIESAEAVVETGLDHRRATPVVTPGQLLQSPPDDVSWQSMSRRSLTRLNAYYLIAEDPQRRLDARPVETLSHQVSLVRHVLQNDALDRLLIADEVGLGKTIEVGLLLKELLAQTPGLRVLYFAPARLVNNVQREFDRLGLRFRQWSTQSTDARLGSDTRVIASIHRAVHMQNRQKVLATPPWDVVIVDECHHLSAWSPDAGDPKQAYSLVKKLIEKQPDQSRAILMSGTPHQGHAVRFENLLRLLQRPTEAIGDLSGRVIYRTKDDITGWDGQPLFPSRQVNTPLVIDLGPEHRRWVQAIHDFYRPADAAQMTESRQRAAGWRCAQAMQWATSSPQAGLGYLARQAVRAGWTLKNKTLAEALAAMRPYRLGPVDEPLDALLNRIQHEVDRQQQDADVDDIEEYGDGDTEWFERAELENLLQQGIRLVKNTGDDKWAEIYQALLTGINGEKVVLFAQPIETVTALSRFLEKKTGIKPALIIGGQSDAEREQEVNRFWDVHGPQFLVSSRAGGEGINLQVAHRLIHIDVPWNPMDMEQRVGRVHRFGSRETIIVDTVVVKDSREADAYSKARQRLQLIAATLVEKERFESVFSRVMALVSQEELQALLLNAPVAPLSMADQQTLADMVQRGFQDWKNFHDKYSTEQKAIKQQNAGLATWDDVVFFMEKYGGAKRQSGYTQQHFRRTGKTVQRVEDEALVFNLKDEQDYIVSESIDVLVYGPDGSVTRRLGLNIGPVAETLRRYAFPDQPAGAAYLRWPSDQPLPTADLNFPFGVLALARQTVQSDKRGGWLEMGTSLHVYLLQRGEAQDLELSEVTEPLKGNLLRGLFRAVIPAKIEEAPDLVKLLGQREIAAIEKLRRPTDAELATMIRHAVTPLLAGIVLQ